MERPLIETGRTLAPPRKWQQRVGPVRHQLICAQLFLRGAPFASPAALLSKPAQAFDEALLAGVALADRAEAAVKIQNPAPLIGDDLEIAEQIGCLVVAGGVSAARSASASGRSTAWNSYY